MKQEELDTLNKDFRPNRAQRRRRPLKARTTVIDYVDVPENALTKATHKIMKLRKKNAPSKQQRKRTIAKARKARKESYSQIS
jgi:hypothetical protein